VVAEEAVIGIVAENSVRNTVFLQFGGDLVNLF
jgi:hypothetical protein